MLSALAKTTLKKQANQEKKIIERPPSAPPFSDLFREVHHFCKTVAKSSIALVGSIENIGREPSLRSQEVNWQCSATAFCSRLSTVYSVYEDVTIPCINEIRAMQQGLRELALNQAESHQTCLIVKTQDELLKYPFENRPFFHHLTEESYSKALKELLLRFGVGDSSAGKHDTKAIHRSIHLAALTQLQINGMKNHRTHMSGDLDEINSLFSHLSYLPEVAVAQEHKASSEKTLDETNQDEKEFREYFPDHGAEFERIFSSPDDDDDDDNDESEISHNEDTCDSIADSSLLSDNELSLVVSLHQELFSGSKTRIDDNVRVRTFVRSYEAASHLSHLTEWLRKSRQGSPSPGSHLFALALRCNVNREAWLSSPPSDSIRDFHNDPFPSESMKADLPMQNLLTRIGQLLTAFPGHAILVALGQVVERVRQLDIQTVSLGKVMSGLEVILRKAQDWEQHASQHVSLGKPLKDISSVVTTWRKLELHTYSHLLTIRENKRSLQAKRHWPRIYSLVHKSRVLREVKPLVNYKSPLWVWKGHTGVAATLGMDIDTKGIKDLAQVLDTFILTSSIAEFKARLELIESFANELATECKVSGSQRLPLARLFQSLWNYYAHFVPLLMQTKDNLREPIEKSLKEEVKLAKWDEQSYYSLVSLLLSYFSSSGQNMWLTHWKLSMSIKGRVKREKPPQAYEIFTRVRQGVGHNRHQRTGKQLCRRH